MVRDRDPFDRTLDTLRHRLARAGPLQGAPLPISGLARELGVSPTPVREVLARLVGEDLIVRRPQGYAALLHDPAQLAELYDLASVLVCAALQAGDLGPEALERNDPLATAQATPNRALARACARVQAQLAPLAQAEAEVFGGTAEDQSEPGKDLDNKAARIRFVRRHYGRRAAHSGRILAVALGLIKSPRI